MNNIKKTTPRTAQARQEAGIFVTFEEYTQQIMVNAASVDWGLELRRIRSADPAERVPRRKSNGSGAAPGKHKPEVHHGS